VFVFRRTKPVVCDALATGESNTPVDDQRLPVIPLIRSMQRVPMNGAKPGELATPGFENPENVRAERG
jgi:hypothetical protein